MFNEPTELIEARLKANWTDTLIDWDNVEFNPVTGTAFIRLQIEWTDTNTKSIGGRNVGEGYTNISIFYPYNKGIAKISKMADDIAAIFDKWDIGPLKFKVSRTVRIGQQEEWYRLDVITPFTYEECS